MFTLGAIVGKKVMSVKGIRTDRRRSLKRIRPEYILFDDGETFIELEEQDYYSFHDCSTSARHLIIHCNKNRWSSIINDDEFYPPATLDIW